MKLFTFLPLIGVLVGCKPSTSSQKAGTTTKAPIIGAFGFVLGEKIPESVKTSPDDDAGGVFAFIETTNFPPFDTIMVSMQPDRTICGLTGMYHGDDWQSQQQLLRSALDEKYGPHQTYPGADAVFWVNGSNSINLSKDILFYNDGALWSSNKQKQKDRITKNL